MIKDDKKKYPSELNTKSIACRIPMGDYVEIMNQCVDKGITINDWLLMKLYSKGGNVVSGNKPSDDQEPEFPEFTIETSRGVFEFNDIDDVENTINHLLNENAILHQKVFEYSQRVNLNNESDRHRVFLSILDRINEVEWDSVRDKIDCRRDFKEMWKDLFD